MQSNAAPVSSPDHGYGAPSYRPRQRVGPTHTHHHYYHRGGNPVEYARPSYKPSYKPSYHAPVYDDYGPPARRPHRYAPAYNGKLCGMGKCEHKKH